LDLLIRSGAGIEEENGNGSTALMAAACGGHPECVKALLAAGAKVDKQNHEGSTALSFALLCEHSEVVTILEEALKVPEETEDLIAPEAKKQTFLESLYSLWNRFFGVALES
jgi:ankyrin repeat protein